MILDSRGKVKFFVEFIYAFLSDSRGRYYALMGVWTCSAVVFKSGNFVDLLSKGRV